MFIVLLKFSGNRSQAGQHMDGHNSWIHRGIDEGVFVLAGSLQPAQGGAIIAYNCSRAELEQRLSEDPFVDADVVTAEILEILPSITIPATDFLAYSGK